MRAKQGRFLLAVLIETWRLKTWLGIYTLVINIALCCIKPRKYILSEIWRQLFRFLLIWKLINVRLEAVIILNRAVLVTWRPSAPFIPWLTAIIMHLWCYLLASDTNLWLKSALLFNLPLLLEHVYLLQVFKPFNFQFLKLLSFSLKRYSRIISDNLKWPRCYLRFEGAFPHQLLFLLFSHSLEILLLQQQTLVPRS